MRYLETWIKNLNAQQIEYLDNKYALEQTCYEDKEMKDLEDFFLSRRDKAAPYSSECSCVSDSELHRLNSKLRGLLCENAIWSAVIQRLHQPLPTAIAHDLIDREIAIATMGHSRQADEVQWRLADFVDEAFYTMAVDRYTDNSRTCEEFYEVMRKYPDERELVDILSHQKASSIEKENCLLKLIQKQNN